MNNSRVLRITEGISRTSAIKMIKTSLAENPGVIIVDLVDVTFPLHRDFFLVLSKKFPTDRFIVRVKYEKTQKLAQSLGIQVELIGLQAEFERTHNGTNLATHNMTMFEYFLYEVRRGWLWLKFVLFERKKKDPEVLYYKKRSSHTLLIVLGLILSITLLLFIFHFAISKTIITITPEIVVRPTSANIIYRTENATGSILASRSTLTLKKLEFSIDATNNFRVDSVDPNSSQNARGIVKIYNTLSVEQDLRPSTRFEAPDGSVFRTQGWVKIPPSRSLNGVTDIGTVDVEVVADVRDESGRLIGERGNIKQGTDLVIPGLKFNRDKVYVKAQSDFFGGENPTKHILTQEELQKFEGVMKEQLQKNARIELQKRLEEEKEKTGNDFALLIPDAVTLENFHFEVTSGHRIGDATEEIALKGTATVWATVFDRKGAIDYLTEIFRANLLQGTDKELAIHTDTLRISTVVSRAPDDSEIKVTLEMNTSTTYDFENPSNELTRRLKKMVTGLSQQEAIDKLMKDGQVKEVHIQTYPFWMSNVSSSIDNIDFYIKK